MSDLEFVQRCIRQDKASWDDFVEKYARLIYSAIHSVAKTNGSASFSSDTAKEIYQELFVFLRKDDFHKLKTFSARNNASLATWLRQVVVNFTVDYLRKLKKPALSLEQEDEDGFSLGQVIEDHALSSRQIVFNQEKAAGLSDCISKLESQEQFFIQMHFNLGVVLGDLKDILGITRENVDTRKSRIIEKLRECFKRKGFLSD